MFLLIALTFVALTLDVLEFHFDHEIERWQLPLTVIYD